MTEAERIIYRLKNPQDLNHLDKTSIHVDGVNRSDHPDYVDAYIDEAYWLNGDALSDEDLDWLNEHNDLVNQYVYEQEFL